MSHRPRKRFGQNFLTNQAIINQIISAIHIKAQDNLIEIGPGQGALTVPLLKQLQHLTVIEIDKDLHAGLQQLQNASERLQLIAADALEVDFSHFGMQQRVVGNLPYNISTPLLLHLLDSAECIEDMHFMLQKEVVMRLAATPGNKDFGRLSIMVQYFCEVEPLFDVPPDAFYPQPKVDSAVVRLIPYKTNPYEPVSTQTLKEVTAMAFSMRRKTIANNMKKHLTKEQLIALDIDPFMRPETLSVATYVRLANYFEQHGNK